jgi:hypothetical protein
MEVDASTIAGWGLPVEETASRPTPWIAHAALTLMLLLAASAVVLAAEAVSSAEAIHLVRAIGAGRTALLGMQLATEHGVTEGKVTAGQLACLKKVDSSLFDEPFVAPIRARFSQEEITFATAFLESPLGVKYFQYGVVQLYRTVGAPGAPSTPEFSQVEIKSLQDFLNGPVGLKLAGPQGVFSTTKSTPIITPTVQSIYSSCKGK